MSSVRTEVPVDTPRSASTTMPSTFPPVDPAADSWRAICAASLAAADSQPSIADRFAPSPRESSLREPSIHEPSIREPSIREPSRGEPSPADQVRHAERATRAEPSQALLDELTRGFASTAEGHDRDATFPFENFERLHREGLVAAVVPTSHGGGGASLAQARRIVAAVAQGEPATALVLTMTYLNHRAMARPRSAWHPALRDQVWRTAVTDGALINALRVEPALGSPSRGGLPDTVARRLPASEGGGWRLSGHKLYSTGIPALRWLAVWARTDELEPRVGTFLVPRDAPGIRVIESWDHLGLRASGSHEVVFDGVALPADHAVDVRPLADWAGGPDADQTAWMVALIGALYDGVARAARDWLLRFLADRTPGNLGAPLSTVPRIQQAVGEIEALLLCNRALLDGLVRQTDTGDAPGAVESGLVKYNVTGNAIRAVDLALQLTGNHGLSRRNPLERHFRDVQCSRIHMPQNDTILLAAGRAAFEPPADARP